MKKNTTLLKWMRRASGFVAVLLLVSTSVGQASARILFEDDALFKVQSEGIVMDENDNAVDDTDVILLQFGNDGTDATFTYTPSATATNEDLTIDVPGDDINFSDDNLTTTGNLNVDGQVDLGDGADTMSINATTADWDLTDLDFDIAGNASEITLTSDGAGDDLTIEVAGATDSSLVLQSSGTSATDAIIVNASAGGITFTDLNDSLTYSQTSAGMGNDLLNAAGEVYEATGAIGSTIGGGETSTSLIHAINAVGTYATSIGAGANDDIDDVYNNGAAGNYYADVDTASTGYNITSTDGDAFTIQNSAGDFAVFQVDAADHSLIDFDPYDFTVDSANAISLDAGAASNFTTSAGAITVSGGDGINIDGTGQEIDITTTGGAIDMNSATFTLDTSSTFSIDGVGASNVTTDSGNLTLSTTTLGDVALNSAADVTLTATNDIIFSDAQIGANIVQLSVTDADWDTDFATDGILDNINDIATQLGGDTISTYNFTNDYVLADNDTVYAALNKIDAVLGAGADNVEDMTFYPEYPDVVVLARSGSNRGTLESFYDDANDTSYYHWTSTRAATQDIDIQFHVVMPPDFTSAGNLTYQYRTGSAVEADNDVEIRVYNATDAMAACVNDTTNLNAGAWATNSIAIGTCGATLDAGDMLLVEINLSDNSGGADYADVGYVKIAYNN